MGTSKVKQMLDSVVRALSGRPPPELVEAEEKIASALDRLEAAEKEREPVLSGAETDSG